MNLRWAVAFCCVANVASAGLQLAMVFKGHVGSLGTMILNLASAWLSYVVLRRTRLRS